MAYDYKAMARASVASPQIADFIKSRFTQEQQKAQSSRLSDDYSDVLGTLESNEQARRAAHERDRVDVYQEPSSLDKWAEKNKLMMASSNKKLQDEAIRNMSTIQSGYVNRDAERMQAEQAAAIARAEGEAPPSIADINTMHDNYVKAASESEARISAFDTMKQALVPSGHYDDGTPMFNPANDKALVYGFAKMLDPTGIVTDKDYKSAASGAGMRDAIDGWISQLRSGTLTAASRNNIANAASNHYNSAIKNLGKTRKQYARSAADYGIKPYHLFDDSTKYEPFEKIKMQGGAAPSAQPETVPEILAEGASNIADAVLGDRPAKTLPEKFNANRQAIKGQQGGPSQPAAISSLPLPEGFEVVREYEEK